MLCYLINICRFCANWYKTAYSTYPISMQTNFVDCFIYLTPLHWPPASCMAVNVEMQAWVNCCQTQPIASRCTCAPAVFWVNFTNCHFKQREHNPAIWLQYPILSLILLSSLTSLQSYLHIISLLPMCWSISL